MDSAIDVRSEYKSIANTNGFSVIDNLSHYISNIISLSLTVAGILFFGYLVIGGLQWLTAGSDTNKVEEAKKHLSNAVIGLAIVATSWAVFLIADKFFGLGLAQNGAATQHPASAPYAPRQNIPF